jgi:DNA-binding CsgD family transcriptional regulator
MIGFPQGVSAPRLSALAHLTAGRPSEARALFTSALGICRRAGYLPEVAWICYEQAAASLTHTDAWDRKEAALLAKEGAQIAERLEMAPLVERLDRIASKLGRRSSARVDFPDGLTAREVEVLRLMAVGKSNRAIAGELVISVHTVLRHVSNIFAKTRTTNRVGATAYAARHRLITY